MTKKLKRNLILTVKVIALTFVLMVVSGIGSKLLPAAGPGDAGAEAAGLSQTAPAPSGNFMALVLTIMFIQVVALALPIVSSRWSGWRLVLMVFTAHFGTVTFMSQIESLVYLNDKMDRGLIYGLFAMGLFVAAVFAPIAVLTLGKWKPSDVSSGTRPDPGLGLDIGRWAWRFLAAGGVYLALYYLFGYYVAWKNPELRQYYGGTDPGSFLAQMSSVIRGTPWMVPLQFVRGLLWVGLGLLVIRSMKGQWWRVGLAMALLFGVPSLYLLFPNPVMPEAIRIAHLIETLPYQFLFGWFLAWLFRARRHAVGPVAAVEA